MFIKFERIENNILHLFSKNCLLSFIKDRISNIYNENRKGTKIIGENPILTRSMTFVVKPEVQGKCFSPKN